jgi:aldose 1-epimerase
MTIDESSPARPPSGEQYGIAHRGLRAEVTQVGATLRSFTIDGQDVIDGFGVDERARDGRGQVLAPWPNRLTDGSYEYGGRMCQAPLNEPSRHDAIHGLVRWSDWSLAAHLPASVTLT